MVESCWIFNTLHMLYFKEMFHIYVIIRYQFSGCPSSVTLKLRSHLDTSNRAPAASSLLDLSPTGPGMEIGAIGNWLWKYSQLIQWSGFSGENLNRKPSFYHQIDHIGFSCECSHHPILWIMVFLVINKGDITNNADMIRLYHEGNMIYNWKKKYIYIHSQAVYYGYVWG